MQGIFITTPATGEALRALVTNDPPPPNEAGWCLYRVDQHIVLINFGSQVGVMVDINDTWPGYSEIRSLLEGRPLLEPGHVWALRTV